MVSVPQNSKEHPITHFVTYVIGCLLLVCCDWMIVTYLCLNELFRNLGEYSIIYRSIKLHLTRAIPNVLGDDMSEILP